MFYSVWDKQCGDYLYSGRNSKSRQDVLDAAFEYLTIDWDDNEVFEAQLDKEGTLNTAELEIEKHKTKISDFDI